MSIVGFVREFTVPPLEGYTRMRGGGMPEKEPEFEIDDTLGTSDNLVAYAKVLDALDGPLAAALSPYLTSLASGQSVEATAI
jgi:hypothetical protein